MILILCVAACDRGWLWMQRTNSSISMKLQMLSTRMDLWLASGYALI